MTQAPNTNIDSAKALPNLAVYGELLLPELLNRYRNGTEQIPPSTLDLSDNQLDQTFNGDNDEGNWSIRQLLGHLMDADSINLLRMRKVFAEKGAILPDWDEHAFIDSGLYGPCKIDPQREGQPAAAFVAMIHTTRQVAANWLGRLQEDDWKRAGLHPRRGEVTIRNILEFNTWHLDHHTVFLRRKLNLMGVSCEKPAAEPCGPGCGCHGNN